MYTHAIVAWLPSAILVAGGVVFAAMTWASLRTWSRDATELPGLKGAVADLRGACDALGGRVEIAERRCGEALDVAEKARRVASSRAARRDRAEARGEEPAPPSPPASHPTLFDAWRGTRFGAPARPREPVSAELEEGGDAAAG